LVISPVEPIRRLTEGKTMVIIEHDMDVVFSLADRIYLMGKAHVGFAGSLDELEARPDIRGKYLEV